MFYINNFYTNNLATGFWSNVWNSLKVNIVWSLIFILEWVWGWGYWCLTVPILKLPFLKGSLEGFTWFSFLSVCVLLICLTTQSTLQNTLTCLNPHLKRAFHFTADISYIFTLRCASGDTCCSGPSPRTLGRTTWTTDLLWTTRWFPELQLPVCPWGPTEDLPLMSHIYFWQKIKTLISFTMRLLLAMVPH